MDVLANISSGLHEGSKSEELSMKKGAIRQRRWVENQIATLGAAEFNKRQAAKQVRYQNKKKEKRQKLLADNGLSKEDLEILPRNFREYTMALADVVQMLKQVKLDTVNIPAVKKLVEQRKIAMINLNETHNCEAMIAAMSLEPLNGKGKPVDRDTLRRYINNIKTVNKAMHPNHVWMCTPGDTQFLHDADAICEFIAGSDLWAESTKTAILTAFKSITARVEGFDDACKVYTKFMNVYAKKQSDHYDEGIMTEKQADKYMDWDEMVQKADLAHMAASKNKLLIQLMIELPPRRVEDAMYLYYTTAPFDQVKADVTDPPTKNYAVINGDKGFLVINKYKKWKDYGQYIDQMPATMVATVKALHLKEGALIFPRPKGDVDPTGTGQFYKAFMSRVGRELSSQPLRISYIMKMNEDRHLTNTDKKLIAAKMGHELNTQQGSYTKNNPKNAALIAAAAERRAMREQDVDAGGGVHGKKKDKRKKRVAEAHHAQATRVKKATKRKQDEDDDDEDEDYQPEKKTKKMKK